MLDEVKTTDGQVADVSDVSGTTETKQAEPALADSGSLLGQSSPEDVTAETDVAKTDSVDEVKTEIEYSDFVMPEGVTMNQELVDSFKPIAKELGLNQEQAQKLVDLQANTIKQEQDKGKLEFEKVKNELRDESIKMLGANFKQELQYADRLFDKLLQKEDVTELRSLLDNSGLGYHPLLIKMFVNAGKAISEDKFVEPKASNVTAEVSLAELMGRGDLIKK